MQMDSLKMASGRYASGPRRLNPSRCRPQLSMCRCIHIIGSFSIVDALHYYLFCWNDKSAIKNHMIPLFIPPGDI